ncbi:hypothetical protein BGZ95_004638 [Linnemannia exigua]|uniref:J domain-containing protein n=1 Tax=Linnemannia exigua TaxID=604196 RepID=A0AAD4H206_9FUNG|nr:hypothetical protein BGZ95_004638 [Linnemannia exigua]
MSNGDKPNYYELLCLEPGASKDDVRKAYRKQALLFHPDKMKPHMKEEASAHFQLISEAYEVLSDDEKRELYDRYGHEGVKAGGDPNPQPDLSGFFPHGGHGRPSHAQPQGFGFGFDSPFFSSFGVPAGAGFNGGLFSTTSSSSFPSTLQQRQQQQQQQQQQPYSIGNIYGSNENILHDIFSGDQAFFANHHQRHMHNLFDHHMESMFGGGGFPRRHGHREPVFPMHDHGFHQQHHDAFFRSAFGNNNFFDQGQQQHQQSQRQRPTLFSTSPFANSNQTQSQSQSQGQWSGTGSRTSPLTNFGSNGDGGLGGFSTSSSSSSSTSMGGGASRTSSRTTIVNGKRTTVTEVTDAQGVTTTTVDNPDGTRETFVNGVPTAIEGGTQPASLEQGTARQQPIVILDDDDVGQRDRRASSRNSADRERDLGRGRSSSGSRDPYRRTTGTAAEAHPDRSETVFLDDDDDDVLYETLSEQQRTQRGARGPVGAGGGASTRPGARNFFDDDPALFHPQMGNGQRLGGSNSPERSRYDRG